MRTYNYSLLITLLFLIPATSQAQWENLSSEDIIMEWSSRGKALAISNANDLSLSSPDEEKGWLVSAGSYQDFHLKLEFKLTPGSEGAVAFRYDQTYSDEPATAGYAVILSDNDEQQNPMGSIFNVARGRTPEGFNVGSWNTLDIIAVGDHLKVLINNSTSSEAHSRRSRYGHIALAASQAEPVLFRNISVKTFSARFVNGPTVEDRLLSHPNPYMEIFDGSSIKDWTSTGTSNWEVQDGVLHGYSGAEGGFLYYKEVYHNFHLKAKFKIIKEDNSGIFIRKPADAESISTDNSIECNIYDHNGFSHAYSTGSIAPHARAWSNITDYDDWNLAEIFAYGDQIVMYVNGIKASEVHLPAFNHPGQICLQAGIKVFSEDQGPSDIYFKDIFIKPVD